MTHEISKLEILKLAAEEKTKAYEDIHYNLIRANNNLSGHRRYITANGLERAALAAESEIKKLERKLEDAEAEATRQNNRVNQDRADYYRSQLAKAKKQLEAESSVTELVAARKHEAELIAEGEKLRDEAKRAEAQKRNADALLKSVIEWLDTAGDVEPVQVTIPDGACIESVRADIERLQSELAELDNVRLPNAELKKQLRAHIAALAERGKPSLSGVDNELTIECGTDALALMAWANPDPLMKKLEGMIDSLPGKALSPKEQQTERVKLEGKILELERVEEALITRDGGDRRADAHPMAVLQVKPKESAKAA